MSERNLQASILAYMIISFPLIFISSQYKKTLTPTDINLLDGFLFSEGLFFAFLSLGVIIGLIYLGIVGITILNTVKAFAMAFFIIGCFFPFYNLYLLINGKLDNSSPHLISGTVTTAGCSKGRYYGSCWIEINYHEKIWQIENVRDEAAGIGKNILVTYKAGLLGTAWVSDYKIPGESP